MTTASTSADSPVWTNSEKIVFRIFFIYFFIQAIPVDWKFYQQLFSINWTSLHYGDIFTLAHYSPQFTGDGFGNWLFIFLIAVIGATVWTITDKNRTTNYDRLYYWIRTVVRYRLAIALVAYGILKIFNLQSPYPSLSNLNTAYGDFNRWKLFSLSLGIVPSYEFFLGLVETTFGLLLLSRKTASIGAFLILVFTGNVFVSNIAYDGGQVVYSFYLITLALFVIAQDLQRIFNLLILQKPTAPNKYVPAAEKPWQKYLRIGLKTFAVFFFVILYGAKTWSGSHKDNYQYPNTKGLAGVSGIYNVSEYRVNGQDLPYSQTDQRRWKDVVFETWNTVSIRSNRPVQIDASNKDRISEADSLRTYELEGSAGRHYYSYDADSASHALVLHNRNKNYAGETLHLTYAKTDGKQIVLTGTDQNNDSLYVVLDKIDKKYLLKEASKQHRGKALKL